MGKSFKSIKEWRHHIEMYDTIAVNVKVGRANTHTQRKQNERLVISVKLKKP